MSKRRGKGEGSIFQRSDGRWVAALQLEPVNGRRRQRLFYGRTRADVAKKLREAQGKQDQNLPLPSERLMVGPWLTAWLEGRKHRLRPRTYTSYKMIVEQHLTPAIGKVALTKLEPADVRGYIASKLASRLSARTVQYHHAVLRAALRQAMKDSLIGRNVASLTEAPKVSSPEIRPLATEQAKKVMGAVAESRDAALFTLSMSLGLRQGELLGLTWADVDFDAETLTVRRTLQRYGKAYHLDEPKTEKSRRTLGLPPALVQLLRAHQTQQKAERLKAGAAWKGNEWNLVFCTEAGEPLSGSHLTHKYQALLDSLGLPRQRWHDMRHLAASYMIANGVDLRVVMEQLGHSQISTTANIYAHVQVDATRDAATRALAALS